MKLQWAWFGATYGNRTPSPRGKPYAPPEMRTAEVGSVRWTPNNPTSKEELDRRFSELYRAHLRDVYSYSFYRVGNHHDAEDLTEQTFLQAYRHFERACANPTAGRCARGSSGSRTTSPRTSTATARASLSPRSRTRA